MVINYDKADVLKNINYIGKDKIEKIKLIVISYFDKDTAADVYANPNIKQPAHYAVDEEGVIKYAPSTTNVFKSNTKWTEKAKQLIDGNDVKGPSNVFEEAAMRDKLSAGLVINTLRENILSSPFTSLETTVRKKIDTETYGDYVLVIETTRGKNYDKTSQNLTWLIAYLMREHGFVRNNFWRIGDIVEGYVSEIHGNPYQYYHLEDWNDLLDNAEKLAKNPNMPVPVSKYCWEIDDHIDASEHCPEPGKDPEHSHSGHIHHWEADPRSGNSKLTVVATTAASIDSEDYETKTLNGSVFKESRFQPTASQTFVKMESNLYEPIYPDLTVPPRSATGLYNNVVTSSKQIIEKLAVQEAINEQNKSNEPTAEERLKPIIGKIPNIFDPYPVDDKIAQLEHHAPIVTMEYEDASKVQANMAYYMINRSINTEKRLVQLENIMATQMRMLNRLASRVKINCVYYGGQSVFDKYKCIRCLSDDLVNDAACVSLDQCLNCSRYEPIEGQVYEIMDGEKLEVGEANVFDDIQASYMTKQDYIELTRTEEMNVEDPIPDLDVLLNAVRKEDDKSYEQILAEANNFVMNWERKAWDYQSPHINEYTYDFDAIVLDKEARLDPNNKYYDGWADVRQKKFQRPDYGTTTLGGSGNSGFNFNSSFGVPRLHGINDFNIDEGDMRLKILQYASEAAAFGEQAKFLYTLGAKITHTDKTPSELVEMALAGQTVNSFVIPSERANDNQSKRAVYTDCSNFAHYIYYLASGGKISIPGTTSDLYANVTSSSPDFTVIGKGKECMEAIKEAIPGDLILYRGANSGHVVIYAGNDEIYEAAGDNGIAETKQVKKGKCYNRNDFVGILRHNALSVPTLKNEQYVDINITLADYVNKYQCVAKQNTKDGTDSGWTTSYDVIAPFVDPTKQMTDELLCQFLRIDSTFPEEHLLAEGILEYFKSKKRSDSMPAPQDFIDAAKESGLNILFLITHCAGETGWGTSNAMCGNWKNSAGQTVYNAYGIACFNEDNRSSAKALATSEGWFTKRDAVIGGAKWIKKNYIDGESKHGIRNTAYFMKWHMGNLIDGNPGSPGTMQYASDINWPTFRAKAMYQLMGYMKGKQAECLPKCQFLIPRFKLANNSPNKK